MQLRGCGTALVTPFHQDGSIDDSALRNLVAWQIESGIDFLVPCGTTGETPTLTHDEWLHVIDTTIEVAAGRVPIVAGATSNSTHDAVEKAKEIAARPGVNAILTASPYYNKPTQEGQYRHFKAIAEAVGDKPVILYNVPGRTGSNLEPGNARAPRRGPQHRRRQGSQRQHDPDCRGHQRRARNISCLLRRRRRHLAGHRTGRSRHHFRRRRTKFRTRWRRSTRAALSITTGPPRATLHRKYLPLMQANFIESSPLPVKAVLAMMGKIEEVYRLPLLPMRRDTRSRLQKIATEVGLITKPAAPAAEAAEFFIYENWAAGPHKIVLHRGSCGQCSHGKGRPAGHDVNHARWHGPYATLAEAREIAHTMTGVLIRSECKCV